MDFFELTNRLADTADSAIQMQQRLLDAQQSQTQQLLEAQQIQSQQQMAQSQQLLEAQQLQSKQQAEAQHIQLEVQRQQLDSVQARHVARNYKGGSPPPPLSFPAFALPPPLPCLLPSLRSRHPLNQLGGLAEPQPIETDFGAF